MTRLNSINGFSGATSIVSGGIEPEYIGAKMVFAQAASPTGWVKLSTYNDYALRIVSGSGGVATTTNQPFSTVFTSSFTAFSPQTGPWALGTTGTTTISIAQMESHLHYGSATSGAGLSGYTTGWPGSGPGSPLTGIVNPVSVTPLAYGGAKGTGGGHAHAGSNVLDTLTVDSPFSFNVKYRDVILAKYN